MADTTTLESTNRAQPVRLFGLNPAGVVQGIGVDAAGNLLVTGGGGGGGGTSSSFGAAFPAIGTAAGFSDGTTMQGARAFDADSGAGTEFVLGALLRKPAAGGSVAFGTLADPVRTDPTGTTLQPVSGTVTANQGTAAAISGKWPVQITDGTNVATVTAGGLLNVSASSAPPADTVGATAALNALNVAASVAVAGQSSVSFFLAAGTLAATLTPEVSGDGGTTWVASEFVNPVTAAISQSLSVTNPNAATTLGVRLPGGASHVRVRVSAFTSGTADGTLRATGQEQQPLAAAVSSAAPSLTAGTVAPLSVTTGGALRVDGSGVTQPVSGTVTSNIGTTGGLALDVTLSSVQPRRIQDGAGATLAAVTAGNALKVDGSAVTQPVSGTVTANIGTSGALALDASVAGLSLAQGAATAGQKAVLAEGAVTTAAPAYTTGNSNPLSLNTAGGLRVDGSGVTQPISAASLPLPAGAATEATLAKLPIAQSTALGTNSGPLAQGSVTTAAPTYTTGNINPLSLNTSGGLRVDGSGVTQPVSGTVTANQGTANATPWNENLSQVAGVAVATAAAGTAKVGVVGNAGAAFDAATASAVPANALYHGNRGTTALPTAVTDGSLVGRMADKFGRAAVVLNSVRDLVGTAVLTSSSITAVTLIPAGAAGVFNDITSYIVTNESGTATIVSLSDGTTTYKFALAANGGAVIHFPTPLPATSAATAWTVLNSAGVSLDHVAVFVKNK